MTVFHGRKEIILFILTSVILPLLLSLCCILVMLHIKGKSNKGLLFSKYNIDLGELNYDEDITANFPFRNTASSPIRILKLRGDCRCTDVSSNRTEVQPGEAGIVAVTFRTKNRRGPETHAIAVQTDFPQQELIKLTLSAVVDPHIELIPRALSFGLVRDKQNVAPREVSVVSRFKEPSKTISVSSSNPYIKATLLSKKPAHSREAGRIRIELCGQPPLGKLEGDVEVVTRTEKGTVTNSMKVVAEILDLNNVASL